MDTDRSINSLSKNNKQFLKTKRHYLNVFFLSGPVSLKKKSALKPQSRCTENNLLFKPTIIENGSPSLSTDTEGELFSW